MELYTIHGLSKLSAEVGADCKSGAPGNLPPVRPLSTSSLLRRQFQNLLVANRKRLDRFARRLSESAYQEHGDLRLTLRQKATLREDIEAAKDSRNPLDGFDACWAPLCEK